MENRVKRFQIYLYDFGSAVGSVQAGKRPVLVIQDDRFNTHSSTTIIATITSAVKKQYLPSHIVLGEQYGLKMPSMVMLEQIRTVNQDELEGYIGEITDTHVKRLIAKAVKQTFGMWNYEPKDPKTVRCLCPRCLDIYKASGSFIVHRLDPFQRERGECDLCNSKGWDYIVTEKKHIK